MLAEPVVTSLGQEAMTSRLQEARPHAATLATCTGATDNRTDSTHHTGIIWRAGPRTGPRLSTATFWRQLLSVILRRALPPLLPVFWRARSKR